MLENKVGSDWGIYIYIADYRDNGSYKRKNKLDFIKFGRSYLLEENVSSYGLGNYL